MQFESEQSQLLLDPHAAVRDALAAVRRELLDQRTSAGHWVGELSGSALSTATAVFALALVDRERAKPSHEPLIRRGLRWLTQHANSDGGWGDTLLSVSNISTTALCWAALSVIQNDAQSQKESPAAPPRDDLAGADDLESAVQTAVANAERWLAKHAGSLAPDRLAAAITARYGKDRTFSVPILTTCALAGRLGEDPWRWVHQLPFELAACPQKWFRWLRLPVVNYALPALIAMGQARHHHRPSRNPLVRFVRAITRRRTLNVLRDIQPDGGGFLEATPLTSFVTMCLAASGQVNHPVVDRAVAFLAASMREDGCWPIDTNLATWVTTLSINALAAEGEEEEGLRTEDSGLRKKNAAGVPSSSVLSPQSSVLLSGWLLGQQYRERHPYTGAAPGAWAWTDLPGGVPDADDTAGALLALHNLGIHDDRTISAARAGVDWLIDLQNRDGGMPTFCRGWGNLPFDRSGADLTAHAVAAVAEWFDDLPLPQARRAGRFISRSLDYLAATQKIDGSWLPLWFGNQHAPADENPTYGTARVVSALWHLRPGDLRLRTTSMQAKAVTWLLSHQHPDGGWGGGGGTPSTIEETALAVDALAGGGVEQASASMRFAVARGAAWLVDQTEGGRNFPASPIGFYFAKLWYFEKLYPLIFTTGALTKAQSFVDS